MMAFVKILLYAVLIFYIISMVINLIFKHKIRKLERQMQEYSAEESHDKQKERNTPHVDPNIGEYTDFEEIEQK